MKREEIIKLVNGTGDAAFVLDPNGVIVAWNDHAAEFFGVSSEHALGNPCSEVLHGTDECGRVCGLDCVVKERSRRSGPIGGYDIQADTAKGREWCRMTVVMSEKAGTAAGYSLHIAQSSELLKRFERLMRDFVVTETNIPLANIDELVSVKRSTTDLSDLTKREIDVLRLLAKGHSTSQISKSLFISTTTVNNHIQRILKKLSAHSRLEAVRRAEKARLI